MDFATRNIIEGQISELECKANEQRNRARIEQDKIAVIEARRDDHNQQVKYIENAIAELTALIGKRKMSSRALGEPNPNMDDSDDSHSIPNFMPG